MKRTVASSPAPSDLVHRRDHPNNRPVPAQLLLGLRGVVARKADQEPVVPAVVTDRRRALVGLEEVAGRHEAAVEEEE